MSFELILYDDQLICDEEKIINFLKLSEIKATDIKVNLINQSVNFESESQINISEIGELLLDNGIVFTSFIKK